jgi:hydroxymethylbilane synthase
VAVRSPVRQSELVADRLRSIDVAVELVIVETLGDASATCRCPSSPGEVSLLPRWTAPCSTDRADVAVHSAKDLPSSETVAGLMIAAVPERADPRDALVGRSLEDLAPGAVVATGSPRRRVQLSNVRPDLAFHDLRGNIGTRLERVPPDGSVVVAVAALERLSLGSHAVEVLPVSVMLPQVGQGAIALRCRDDDERTVSVLEEIDDEAAHVALRAERAFLARLGGGCDAPVGAYATVDEAASSTSRPCWRHLMATS